MYRKQLSFEEISDFRRHNCLLVHSFCNFKPVVFCVENHACQNFIQFTTSLKSLITCSVACSIQKMHTYIYNWSLQPFSQDYVLASHTTHVVCVNYIREWRDLQFYASPNGRFFEKLFHGKFIYAQIFDRNLLRGNRRRNIFSYFVLMPDLG